MTKAELARRLSLSSSIYPWMHVVIIFALYTTIHFHLLLLQKESTARKNIVPPWFLKIFGFLNKLLFSPK